MNRGFSLRERAQGNLGLFLLCAILLLVSLAIWPGVALEPFKAHIAEFAACLLLFCARKRSAAALPTLSKVSLCLLVASWALSTIASVYPAWSFWGNPDRGRGFVLFAACLACLQMARRANLGGIWALCTVIGISAGIAAWYAVLQALGGDPFHWTDHPHSMGGTFGNPSYLRDWLAVAVVVMVVGVFPQRKRIIVYSLSLVLILFVAWTGTSRWPSMHYRLAVWSAIGSHAAGIPVLGYGPDMGGWTIEPWSRDAISEPDRTHDRAENLILDTLVERGWFGLGAELLFWGYVLWTGRRSVYLLALLCCLVLACLSVLSVPSQVLAYVLAGLVLNPFTAAARGADQPDRSKAGVQIAIGDLRVGGPAITTIRHA